MDGAKPLIRAYIATSFLRNPSQQAGVIAMHEHALKGAMKALDAHGMLPRFPNNGTAFADKTASELIDAGMVVIKINNATFLQKMKELLDTTLRLVSAFELSLVISPDGRIAIGDHPLTFLHPTIDVGPYGIPFGGQSCELTFPVSKHVCLIGRWHEAFPKTDAARAIEQLNRRQVLFASMHVAVEGELGNLEDMLIRYANVSFKTDTQTLPFADSTGMIVMRRGLLPTSEWRQVRGDVVELRTVL